MNNLLIERGYRLRKLVRRFVSLHGARLEPMHSRLIGRNFYCSVNPLTRQSLTTESGITQKSMFLTFTLFADRPVQTCAQRAGTNLCYSEPTGTNLCYREVFVPPYISEREIFRRSPARIIFSLWLRLRNSSRSFGCSLSYAARTKLLSVSQASYGWTARRLEWLDSPAASQSPARRVA
jgi:hypothetical protein